jgi:hypothetical protein
MTDWFSILEGKSAPAPHQEPPYQSIVIPGTSFVTGGSAVACGFVHERAESRILGAPPVLVSYKWRMPGVLIRRGRPRQLCPAVTYQKPEISTTCDDYVG